MLQIIEGNRLLVAVRRTREKITVIDGQSQVAITPEIAAELVRDNDLLEGVGTKRRIFMIRASSARAALLKQAKLPTRLPWGECWRTAEAAVMQPGLEWLYSRRSGVAA